MTITDPNGNTLKEGKPACNWAGKHAHEIIRRENDGAGRTLVTFRNGYQAIYFANDIHRKLLNALTRKPLWDSSPPRPAWPPNQSLNASS